MCNSEEHVEPECPCYKCIVLGMCKNKEIHVLMSDCTPLYKYLYKDALSTPKLVSMDIINLYQFCGIMGIKIDRRDGDFVIRYGWQR